MTFRCLLRNFGSGYLAKDMVSGPRGPGRQTARMRGVEFLRLDLEEDPCTKSSEGDDPEQCMVPGVGCSVVKGQGRLLSRPYCVGIESSMSSQVGCGGGQRQTCWHWAAR